MNDWMWGYGWGMGWWFGPLFMVLFGVLLILALVLFAKWVAGQGTERSRGLHEEDSALEILKKRYARGEIGKEEYEEKRKDLLE